MTGGSKEKADSVGVEAHLLIKDVSTSDQYTSSNDFIFDIGVTANRPDALGHIGLARELAALFELSFQPPMPDAPARVAAATSIDKLVKEDNAFATALNIKDGKLTNQAVAEAHNMVDVLVG